MVYIVTRHKTQQNQTEERLMILQRMTAAFSTALMPEEVVERLLQDGTAALGAAAASVVTVSTDGTQLEILQAVGYPQELLNQWRQFPIDPSTAPLAVAVRTRTPVWLKNPAERTALMGSVSPDSAHQAWAAIPLTIRDRVIGGLGLSFSAPKEFDDNERAFIVALAQQCAQAIERAQLYAAEQGARQTAERSADQLARLQLLTDALSKAITLAQVAEVLTHQSVLAAGANAGVVNLFYPQTQELEIIYTHGFHRSLVERFKRTSVFAPGASPLAAQTKRAVWFHTKEEYLAQFPDLELVPQRQNAEAIAGLPLLYQERLLGVLGLYFSEPRDFHPYEQEFLLTIGRQCAVALERAQLYEAEQTTRHRAEQTATWLTRLQFVTAALSQALTTYEVSKIIIDSGMAVLGALNGAVNLLVDDNTFELSYTAGSLLAPRDAQEWRRFPANPALPATEVARSGQPLWLEDAQERNTRYPLLIPLNETYPGGWAFLPLRIRERPIGTAGFIFPHNRPFTPEEREFMLTLAHYCSQALERARLIEDRRELGAAEERQRLARELHDAVTQTLFSASLMADTLPTLMDRDIDLAKALVNQLLHLNRAALAEMRTLLLELRPEQVVKTALSELLTQLAQAVRGRKNMELSLAIESSHPLPPDAHITFYRIAQEALNNIVKHSQATQGLLYLNSVPGQAHLRIQDNGRGFILDTPSGGLGLGTMQERAAAIGATIQVMSEIGHGTQIHISWIDPS
jgi:signal transduction histidine kinase